MNSPYASTFTRASRPARTSNGESVSLSLPRWRAWRISSDARRRLALEESILTCPRTFGPLGAANKIVIYGNCWQKWNFCSPCSFVPVGSCPLPAFYPRQIVNVAIAGRRKDLRHPHPNMLMMVMKNLAKDESASSKQVRTFPQTFIASLSMLRPRPKRSHFRTLSGQNRPAVWSL